MDMDFTSLSLLSGTPFIIPELQLEIKQPTIRDIAMLGEYQFYQSLSLFSTSKEQYLKQATLKFKEDKEEIERFKEHLELMSDLTLMLEILNTNQELKSTFVSFLYLLVPKLQKCSIDERLILLSLREGESNTQKILAEKEFELLRQAVDKIFETGKQESSSFNPANDKASEIAAKIEARRKVVAKEVGSDGQKTSALATAVSIISTADGVPLNEVLDYTIPQLYFQLERSKKYNEYKTQITLGAFGGLKDVEIAEWMESI